MTTVFISHTSKDDDFTRRLADSLTYDFGTPIWVDFKDNPGGIKWPTGVQKGLDECEIMVVVISPDAIASRHVEDEWQNFVSDNKVVIPLIWKPIEKFPYQLKLILHIDFHKQDYKLAFKTLCTTLQEHGVVPTIPSSPNTINRCKPANVFWLCHDLLELFRWLLSGISKEWIDVGLRQVCHHGNQIDLDPDILGRLERLRDRASPMQENDWTEQKRVEFANEVKIVFNVIAQEIQAANPNFDSGPG